MAVIIEFGYLPCGFSGFARQPKKRTVEGEIIRVLTLTDAITSAKDSGFKSSSRTDKGVGAFQNYMVVRTRVVPKEILRRLNSMIDGGFFVGAGEIGDDFNPRHALYREYVYYLSKREVGENMSEFRRALSLFQGTHCFYNFTKRDRTKSEEYFKRELTLEPIVIEERSLLGEEILIISFRSRFFLYRQVRKILSAALMVANNKISSKVIEEALMPGAEKKIFPSHSPDGLYLKRVKLSDEIEMNIRKYPVLNDGMEGTIRDLAVKFLVTSHLLEKITYKDQLKEDRGLLGAVRGS